LLANCSDFNSQSSTKREVSEYTIDFLISLTKFLKPFSWSVLPFSDWIESSRIVFLICIFKRHSESIDEEEIKGELRCNSFCPLSWMSVLRSLFLVRYQTTLLLSLRKSDFKTKMFLFSLILMCLHFHMSFIKVWTLWWVHTLTHSTISFWFFFYNS
jgi:hypothetical protein